MVGRLAWNTRNRHRNPLESRPANLVRPISKRRRPQDHKRSDRLSRSKHYGRRQDSDYDSIGKESEYLAGARGRSRLSFPTNRPQLRLIEPPFAVSSPEGCVHLSDRRLTKTFAYRCAAW